MKIYYLLLILLINLSFSQRLIDLQRPIKPFISVPTLKSLKDLTKQTPEKFLSIQENKKIFTEGNSTDGAEDKLRNISFTIKCMFVDNFALYDIRGLSKNSLADPPYYVAEVDGATINYNFCYNLKQKGICSNSSVQDVQVSGSKDEKCTNLAGGIGTGNKWELGNNTINITLNQIKNSNDVVKFVLICDPDKTHTKQTTPLNNSYFQKNVDGKLETVLYFKSHEACAEADFYVIWKFINDYNWIFAILLIFAGVFECIFGRKLLKPTSFIISCAVIIVVVVVFFVQFILPSGTASWIIWVILAIAASIGIYLGYVVAKYDDKFISLLVGGLGGFVLGELFYNLFGNQINLAPLLVNILFVLISIVVLVIIAFFLKKPIIIFCTSLIGSYATIRGISFLAGGFPSEFTIIDLIKAGETEQIGELLDWSVYIYLVSIIVMTGLGVFIQIKINYDDKFKDSDDIDDNLVQ